MSRHARLADRHDQPLPQVIRELCDLIEATERLRDAVRANDRDMAADATAALVPPFIVTFGHDDEFVREVLNFLGRTRKLVLADRFQEAEALVLAWLIRMHRTAATLAGALRK